MAPADEIPVSIWLTSVTDSMRAEQFRDKNAPESEAIEAMFRQIAIDHGGTHKSNISVPRGTRKSLETLVHEITRFHQQFEFLIAAGGLGAILRQIKEPLEKWMQNRQARTARIRIGDVEVELTGEGIDKAVAIAEALVAKREGKSIIL